MEDLCDSILIHVEVDQISLEGMLSIPLHAKGLVLFAHGSGSSRLSPRNNYVAKVLRKAGLGTLLIDLLSKEEDADYEKRFDIDLLEKRLLLVIDYLNKQPITKRLALGLFGASTGAAAALKVAALSKEVKAVVSRGGRPDLAKESLSLVEVPTLFIVGGDDFEVLELNKGAFALLPAVKKIEIVPGATHLFEEPGCLEEVARLSVEWFVPCLSV